MENRIHFFSVSIVIIPTRLFCQNARALFWSLISNNHIQVHENDFCHCLFTDTQNVKLGIFTGSRAVDIKEMYKKA